jgi:hypothetical protein
MPFGHDREIQILHCSFFLDKTKPTIQHDFETLHPAAALFIQELKMDKTKDSWTNFEQNRRKSE